MSPFAITISILSMNVTLIVVVLILRNMTKTHRLMIDTANAQYESMRDRLDRLGSRLDNVANRLRMVSDHVDFLRSVVKQDEDGNPEMIAIHDTNAAPRQEVRQLTVRTFDITEPEERKERDVPLG